MPTYEPQWENDSVFWTPHFRFVSGFVHKTAQTTDERIALYKPRHLLDHYCRLLGASRVERVLEVGFHQGGMPMFLADMLPDAKIVAVDINPVPPPIERIIEQNHLRIASNFMAASIRVTRPSCATSWIESSISLWT